MFSVRTVDVVEEFLAGALDRLDLSEEELGFLIATAE
jgi:hypothetical protein